MRRFVGQLTLLCAFCSSGMQPPFDCPYVGPLPCRCRVGSLSPTSSFVPLLPLSANTNDAQEEIVGLPPPWAFCFSVCRSAALHGSPRGVMRWSVARVLVVRHLFWALLDIASSCSCGSPSSSSSPCRCSHSVWCSPTLIFLLCALRDCSPFAPIRRTKR